MTKRQKMLAGGAGGLLLLFLLWQPFSFHSVSHALLPHTKVEQSSICTTATKNVDKFACVEAYYTELVDSKGVDAAFVDLKKRYASDPFVAVQCHPITHAIGREAGKKYTVVSEAYMHGDSFCWSGYYHGVLEAIIHKIGENNLPKQIDSICATLPGKSTYSFSYYNCVHGLGHGIMELKADDVFKSVAVCDNLTGSWERQSCYSGVFMENIVHFDSGAFTPDLKKTQPLYPCTAVAEKYKTPCYLGQTSFVLSQNGGDFKKTFELCATVAVPYRSICDQSLGRDAANYARHDGATTKSSCSLATTDADSSDCIVGAVKEFISYYHAIDQSNAYCNLYTDPQKKACLETGKQYFTLF
jgi:hypothetical protein